jgi:peptide/nickel transport system permease protein
MSGPRAFVHIMPALPRYRMSQFLFKRLLTLSLTLLGASVVIFAVLEILPGNAAQMLMGPDAAPEAVQALAEQLGLHHPPLERYGRWISGLVQGDMGDSYAYSSPVLDLVLERLALTVPLALIAMLLTTVLALVTGVYAAAHHNRAGDVGLMSLAQIGIAIPNFWFAILLILLFSVHLQWFSAGGFPGWSEDDGGGLVQGLKALLLPAISLAVVQAAILARITRSAVLEVMREDFVRTARAKGVSRRSTLWRHVLRNAMIPVITVMGLQFANLLAGTIVVENVFYLPGLGRLIFQSIANRDLIVVRNCVMLLAAMVVVVNFIVDILYAVIDPRVKASDI